MDRSTFFKAIGLAALAARFEQGENVAVHIEKDKLARAAEEVLHFFNDGFINDATERNRLVALLEEALG
jgi:hypothetical protein